MDDVRMSRFAGAVQERAALGLALEATIRWGKSVSRPEAITRVPVQVTLLELLPCLPVIVKV